MPRRSKAHLARSGQQAATPTRGSRFMHPVRAGLITTILAGATAAFGLAAAAYPLLQSPPAPAGMPARQVITSADIDRSAEAQNVASMKATVMGYAAQQEVLAAHRARHKAAPVTTVTTPQARTPPPPSYPVSAGAYSYAGLEHIWEANGGSSQTAAVAACIAEHESGGRANAISPTSDYGLWQIHDDPAALNPSVSAATAVRMSFDGTNWSAWTTAGSCGV
jgi:Transglycosylase SLT domain